MSDSLSPQLTKLWCTPSDCTECHIYKTEIPETDWEQNPASVKGRMEEIRQLIEELEEKLNLDVKELIITTISISTQCRKESSKEKEWSSYNWVGLAKTKRSPISDPFAQRLRFGVGQCGMNFWAMTN